MPKTLVLRTRMDGQWHDAYIFSNVLTAIAQHKPIGKSAVWMSIAGRAELAKEEATHTEVNPQGNAAVVVDTFSVELRNVEARLFWKEIQKLRPMDFGKNAMGQPTAPSLGMLNTMLTEWAECLEQEMPKVDEEEDEPD